MISFFIPFYNEEQKGKKLNLFLKDLKKFIKHPANKKNYFLLYNDGSTDRTENYLENFKRQFKGKKILILNKRKFYLHMRPKYKILKDKRQASDPRKTPQPCGSFLPDSKHFCQLLPRMER